MCCCAIWACCTDSEFAAKRRVFFAKQPNARLIDTQARERGAVFHFPDIPRETYHVRHHVHGRAQEGGGRRLPCKVTATSMSFDVSVVQCLFRLLITVCSAMYPSRLASAPSVAVRQISPSWVAQCYWCIGKQ
jgi:hypothetical protein